MQNLRNKLIAGGAVMILAAIGTMMNRQAMQAAGGPSVTIESPIPLPVTGTVAVTGSTTVSGTVAATQSGTWNVGVTGTPNVNVANPATAPALTLDNPYLTSKDSQNLSFSRQPQLMRMNLVAY